MNLRDLCRLLLTTPLSSRAIARMMKLSPATPARYRALLAAQELSWPAIAGESEKALHRRLNVGAAGRLKKFAIPDWSQVERELGRTGVTLTTLHEEYTDGIDATSDLAMSLSEFRRRFEAYRRTHGLVMRQIRRPGEQLFIDYSGRVPCITDPETGEATPVELFVTVMGASRKTFIYATLTQRLPDFVHAHVMAMQFYGGVSLFWVPDNLKSAVDSRSKDDGALINHTYNECARHYDAIVLPARARKPKDKAPVEVGVRLAQRWVLARLRNRIFFSLTELNKAIGELTDRLNSRGMRAYGGKSRNQLFDELDRPALKPLPITNFEYGEWLLNRRVGPDYRVLCDDHFYSVPSSLVGQKVNVKASRETITIYQQDRRVALHYRSNEVGGHSVLDEHMPDSHRGYAKADPAMVIAWAKSQGGAIDQLVQNVASSHRRPFHAVNTSRSLQRLAREWGVDRLQAACERALAIGTTRTPSIESMLRHQLERAPLSAAQPANDEPPAPHDNVRGSTYYE